MSVEKGSMVRGRDNGPWRFALGSSLVLAATLLASTSVGAQVRWEDYRGDSRASGTATAAPGVLAKPTFGNADNSTSINNLRALAVNPANAVRSGSSTSINFLDTQHHLCDDRLASSGGDPGGQACQFQAMGRVAYARIRFPQAGTYTLAVAHDDSVEVNLSSNYTSPTYRSVSYDIPVGGLGGWTTGPTTFAGIGSFTATAGSCALIRVYWTNQGGLTFNRLAWNGPGTGGQVVIPASAYSDPSVAAPADCTGSINGNARSITLDKVLGSQRANASDQFLIEIATAASGGTVRQVSTSGAGVGQQASTGAHVVTAGGESTFFLRESMVAGSASTLAGYETGIACTRNGIAFAATPVSSTAASRVWSVTMPSSSTPNSQVVCRITNTRIGQADLSITKTDGATTYTPGQALTYTIVVANAGPGAASDAVFTDPAVAALSVTGVSCASAAGGAACPATANTTVALMQGAGIAIPALPVGGSVTFTVAATVNAGTTGNVSNTASIAVPAGMTDPNPGNNSATDTNAPAIPSFDFCAADTIYNHDQTGSGTTFAQRIHRFNTTTGMESTIAGLLLPLPGATEVNALMIDPVANRLITTVRTGANSSQLWAYDAANGGWYQASPAFTGSAPRAGMSRTGVGYLIGSGNTPQVWRVEASGTFTYSVAPVGNLSYNVPPTDAGSGDLAFDVDGVGWLAVGRDLWTIDFPNASLQAIRQQRPTYNGSPLAFNLSGIAFGSDGGLYVANSGNPSPASGYYRIDLDAGTIALAGSATNARDLASCAFPALTPPELRVVKTLATVNGAPYVTGQPVGAGDVLGYAILVSHVGGNLAATLYAGDVVETLPAHTAYVAAGNDFSCTGSACASSADASVPVGGSATFDFFVQVDALLPPGTASIDNVVAVNGESAIDCSATGNDCVESTPLAIAAALWIAKTNTPEAGVSDLPGDVLLSGATTLYEIVVGNNGPAVVQGARLTDVATGLSSCALASTACEVRTGNAACPTAGSAAGQLSVDNLFGAGVQIPSIEAGGELVIRLACTVD